MKKIISTYDFIVGGKYSTKDDATIFKVLSLIGDDIVYQRIDEKSRLTTCHSVNIGYYFYNVGVNLKFGR